MVVLGILFRGVVLKLLRIENWDGCYIGVFWCWVGWLGNLNFFYFFERRYFGPTLVR